MREIGEGDIIFLYIVKLVPPKDLGSIVHFDTIDNNTIHQKHKHYVSWQYSLKVPTQFSNIHTIEIGIDFILPLSFFPQLRRQRSLLDAKHRNIT